MTATRTSLLGQWALMSTPGTRKEKDPGAKPRRYRELPEKKLKLRQLVLVTDAELQRKQLQRPRSCVNNLWEVNGATTYPHCQFDGRCLGG